jgi:hypothetical protein
MRRTAVFFVAAAFVALAPAARAQTASNDFDYSPEAQERGKNISISGRCVDSEELLVTVQEGAAGDGSVLLSKSFPAQTDAKVSGSITVPDDAPFGPYVITGTCRTGATSDFSKNGPFAVVEKAAATTTTAKPTAITTSSTTSTTVAGATTTTGVTPTELPATVDDNTDDLDATTTTVDEFAGTRNDNDDDSIGPLLLLVGLVPLGLAIGAIGLAMRRRTAAPPAEPSGD